MSAKKQSKKAAKTPAPKPQSKNTVKAAPKSVRRVGPKLAFGNPPGLDNLA